MSAVRDEAVQVAAVALAIVQWIDTGHTPATPMALSVAFASAAEERRRQEDKWGDQQHPIEWWLAILIEEVGELAEAALEDRGLGSPSTVYR